MQGHVAQSVSGALPSGVAQAAAASANTFVGQILTSPTIDTAQTQTFTVGDGGAWAFIEAVGPGGRAFSSGGSFAAGGGGAGNDTLIAVLAGKSFSIAFATSTSASASGDDTATVISYDGTPVLTARGGNSAASGTGAGVSAGKYPGGAPSTTQTGRGGGRLAGKAASWSNTASSDGTQTVAGVGAGSTPNTHTNQTTRRFGQSLVCITVFSTRDAALAFANSQYNGAWVPS